MISKYAFFLLLWCTAALAQNPNSIKSPDSSARDKVQKNIAVRMDSLFHALSGERGFNGNVLIAQEGKIIYKNSFGYSDLKRKIPLNIKSVFEIGSVTKQFTAMAIMILHDEGKLDFTDPVQKFFPKFPYKDITIHQLLAHRSGLPEYMRFAGRYWKNRRKLMRNSDLMEILTRRHPELIFSPDGEYYYSNTGYIVLASIVEQVSGMSYASFLEKRIFRPLGMKRTFVNGKDNFQTVEYPTLGYKRNKKKAEIDFLCGTVGDKGIYSTVEDMLKWDQGLYSEKLVRKETLEEAFTRFSYDWSNEKSYGYGWRIETGENGEKIVYHAGQWRGYSSLFIRRMSDRSAIIILCNKVNSSYEDIDLLMSIIDSSKQIVAASKSG